MKVLIELADSKEYEHLYNAIRELEDENLLRLWHGNNYSKSAR